MIVFASGALLLMTSPRAGVGAVPRPGDVEAADLGPDGHLALRWGALGILRHMTGPAHHDYGSDIYTEAEGDDDTLARLGPLRPLAGTWTSARGADVHPVGPGLGHHGDRHRRRRAQPFVEVFDLQPIDPQTNGPQLLYGLRYHTHIVKPGEVETFHDQVGYWLWEPAAGLVLHSLAIPRGQVVLAAGPRRRRTPASSR